MNPLRSLPARERAPADRLCQRLPSTRRRDGPRAHQPEERGGQERNAQ